MTVAIALLILAALLALFLLALVLDWARRALTGRREHRAMRIRDAELRKWGMAPWTNKERQE